MEEAKQKDAEREQAIKEGEVDALPIMHGVPMSVKDIINQKGHLSTIGTAFLCERVMTQDSPLVTLYKKAGAIPIVRGNTPQSALSLHTNNTIFGEAKNPYDHSRSCGGSSGGDAGMVALRCVPLGLGSDIGGSLRYPATFCGIAGFKPTQNRLTKRGTAAPRIDGFNMYDKIDATAGPMGATV